MDVVQISVNTVDVEVGEIHSLGLQGIRFDPVPEVQVV